MHINLQQQKTGQQLLGPGQREGSFAKGHRQLWAVTEISDASPLRVCVHVHVCFQTHPVVHFKYVKFIVHTVYLKKAVKKEKNVVPN